MSGHGRSVGASAACLVMALALGACTTEPLSLGQGCDLTSDCDAPLVCRIGKCRIECINARDCAAGLNCIYDDQKLGSCQLPDEARCALNSDCTSPLVCAMGTCTNACATDEDCAPGATCDSVDGVPSCVDHGGKPCIYSSDCPMGNVCAVDQRCRQECTTDYDCRFGTSCVERDFVDFGISMVCEFPQ